MAVRCTTERPRGKHLRAMRVILLLLASSAYSPARADKAYDSLSYEEKKARAKKWQSSSARRSVCHHHHHHHHHHLTTTIHHPPATEA
jgi:hypothetical protein